MPLVHNQKMHSWMHETKDAQNCSIDSSTKHVSAFVACEDTLGTVQFVSIPTHPWFSKSISKSQKRVAKEWF